MDKFTLDGSERRGQGREFGAAHCWAVTRKIALGLSLAIASQSALAQAMYRIQPLGNLGGCTSLAPIAFGFNEASQVGGYTCNADGDSHAFLWKNDGTPMVDLGPNEVGSWSFGVGINAFGQVAGWGHDSNGTYGFVASGDGTSLRKIRDSVGGFIEDSALNELGQVAGTAYMGGSFQHAFLWTTGSPLLDLGTLGGVASFGLAINASGQVAGYSYLPSNVTHAFVWKNDGSPMLDLGTLGSDSSAYYINASGQVAGTSTLPRPFPRQPEREHAFFWRNDGTPIQDLGTLGGTTSVPSALNDSGQIAGYSYKRGTSLHAFVWMNDGTPMKDLGTFGGTRSDARDINSSGQVTGSANLAGDAGTHAFLWRNDGSRIQDLNKLIDPKDPLKRHVILTGGDFINDLGNILAEGTDSRTGLSGLYLLEGTFLTLAPRALAFDNLPINTVSSAKSVTLTNTSAKIVAITGIALAGVDAGQFASTNNCGNSLPGHANCTISVTFGPTSTGAKSAFLHVNGGGGGLRSVRLTGTGT